MEVEIERYRVGGSSSEMLGGDYVNFVWMISGFSCQSSILTHICIYQLADLLGNTSIASTRLDGKKSQRQNVPF